jgi:hypothetical protein
MLYPPRTRRLAALFSAVVLVALAACTSTSSPASPSHSPPGAPIASPSPGSETPSPSASTGFSFDAESVVGYYRTQGYVCTGPQPSALADGYQFTNCQLVDSAGRTRVVGVVTDSNDDLADGFASVRGAASEPILDPSAALDPLAGFLGAMLGQSRGESLLTWLAGHLGDAFAETTIDTLQVATYIKGDDHSTIYVEVANQNYLEAPRPSPT